MTRRRCYVRFCDRDGDRELHTIPLCDTHFGLGRKNGIDWLPLIQSARRKLDELGIPFDRENDAE